MKKVKNAIPALVLLLILSLVGTTGVLAGPGESSAYHWTIFGGANLFKPGGISNELGNDPGFTAGFGYFISQRGRLGFSYSSNEMSGNYFRGGDVAALSILGQARPGLDGPGLYSTTRENLSVSRFALEYLHYYDGRQDARRANPGSKNMTLRNVFPFIGVSASMSTADYDQMWLNGSGKRLMERTRETDIYTGSLILGADFKIDHNLTITARGEYAFGEESAYFSAGDYTIDPDGVLGFTATESFNGARYAAANSGLTGPFDMDLGGPSFSLCLSHTF